MLRVAWFTLDMGKHASKTSKRQDRKAARENMILWHRFLLTVKGRRSEFYFVGYDK